MNPLTIKQTEPNVVVVNFDDVSSGWEQWVMLSSDRHHDSPYCDRDKERRHLEKAKKHDALIIDAGDVFDAMQGQYDPRRSLDNVREEDVGEDYLDRLVEHAARDYTPYAEHWLVMGRGNHETDVRKHNGTDLTNRLVLKVRQAISENSISVGGYGGWVKFVFRINQTKSQSCNIKYFHGRSTRAPVTKGVIQTNRQAVIFPDADIVVNGHNHESYIVQQPRERLTLHGNIARDHIDFVRCPGYKDVWQTMKGEIGFEAQLGEPKITGCAWIRFYYQNGVAREITLDTS